MARKRIVGITSSLPPQGPQELGGASTPYLAFCQVAFLLTEQLFKSLPLGRFQFYIQKWGNKGILKVRGLGKSLRRQFWYGVVLKSWVVSNAKTG